MQPAQPPVRINPTANRAKRPRQIRTALAAQNLPPYPTLIRRKKREKASRTPFSHPTLNDWAAREHVPSDKICSCLVAGGQLWLQDLREKNALAAVPSNISLRCQCMGNTEQVLNQRHIQLGSDAILLTDQIAALGLLQSRLTVLEMPENLLADPGEPIIRACSEDSA